MVEGPGCTRNGIKLQKVINQKVRRVEIPSSSSSSSSSRTPECLVNWRLTEAFSVGKELFLIFSSLEKSKNSNDSNAEDKVVAMRLHFGMDGTLVLGKNGKGPNVPQWRSSEQCSLRLELEDDSNSNDDGIVQNSNSSMNRSPRKQSCQKDNLAIIDLTTDENTTTYKSLSSTTNSHKPPIYNPYLKKSSNNPHITIIESRASTITYPYSATTARTKLTTLAHRDVCSPLFSPAAVFATLRSHPSLKISNAILDQSFFPGVGNVIKIEALHRAQVDPTRLVGDLWDEELHNVIHNCREFSMDWLTGGSTPVTYVYNKTVCGTCGTPGVRMMNVGGGMDAGRSSLSRVTFWCVVCQPKDAPPRDVVWDDVINEDEEDMVVFGDGEISVTTTTASIKSPSATPPCHPPPTSPNNSPRRHCCPTHGPDGICLRRVRKKTINRDRLFYACRKKNCRYFSWADDFFPTCRCRKRSVLRVSKTETSGGRWFLSCVAGGKGRSGGGCGFFEWVDELKKRGGGGGGVDVLGRLGNHLIRPLL